MTREAKKVWHFGLVRKCGGVAVGRAHEVYCWGRLRRPAIRGWGQRALAVVVSSANCVVPRRKWLYVETGEEVCARRPQ